MSQSQIEDFVHDLGDAARRNPLSAALIGAGLVWLLAGDRISTVPIAAGRRVGELAGGAVDLAASGLQLGSESLSSGVSAAQKALVSGTTNAAKSFDDHRETVSKNVEKYADTVSDWSSDSFDNVRDNLTALLREQPLALGALGIAVGAAIAASMPISNLERDHLGDASASAGIVANNAVDDLMSRGEKTITAVTDAMQSQGLTSENVKGSVNDIIGKVKSTISSVKKS
jgi:hypothetical protein